MPFEAVSSSSMWKLVHLIIDQKIELTSIMTSTLENFPCVKNLDVSPSEGIFLLTALSNMAIARDESDKVFIETVTKLILEVCYLFFRILLRFFFYKCFRNDINIFCYGSFSISVSGMT